MNKIKQTGGQFGPRDIPVKWPVYMVSLNPKQLIYYKHRRIEKHDVN
jgi:hypothetical protein